MAKWDAILQHRPGEQRRSDVISMLAGNKVSKETANYRVGTDAENGKSCFECLHYEIPGGATSSCRRVLGPVEARDVCDLFTTKSTDPSQGHTGTAPN